MRDRAIAIIFRAVAISACVLTSSCAPSSGSSSNKPGEIMHHDLSPNSVVAPSAKQPIPAAEIAQAARDSFEKGIGWAITNQRANGNWGSLESARAREIYLDTLASHLAFQTATTAIVTWSLIEPARTNPKCRAALERGLTELSSRKPPGRASGKTF